MADPQQFHAKAIIFDLDGTLADTFPLIVSAWNAAITPHTGLSYSDAEVIARFGIPDPAMILRELPGDAGAQAVEVYHAHYERQHGIVTPFPGVTEILRDLRRRAVPLGLMTGKGRRSARITLDRLGWGEMFGVVITGEDVERQKPDPDGPLAAARALDVPAADCAFVGDSPADIGAARAARMVSVAAGWHPVFRDAIRAMRPNVWAETPADVLRLINNAPAAR